MSKESPGKNTSASNISYPKLREEGWKEVVSKSSGPRSLPLELKKVQVPTHAISRVIGRAGSNINAIRSATGAHIEVEKQGKVPGDRSITIKGTNEATKQAYHLITTLIRDPDVDIFQVLKKEGIGKVVTASNSSSQHITISTWDSKSSKPGSTTSSQDGDAFPSKKASAKTVIQSVTVTQSNASKSTIATPSSSRPATAKNLFASSSANAIQTSRSVVSSASQRVAGVGSKTITSYSSTIKPSTKNQPTASQTFAARVSSVNSDG